MRSVIPPDLMRIFCVLVLLTTCRCSFSQSPDMALTLTAPATAVRLGGPIVVTAILTNTSNTAATVDRVNGELYYEVVVRDASGGILPPTEYEEGIRSHEMAIVSSRRETIAPGRDLMEKIDLGKVAAIQEPGQYTVTVDRSNPLARGQTLISNTVTITVTQ